MSEVCDHGLSGRRRRGSQPGVARGSYKPRRNKPQEPQTPEELAKLAARARDFWGDEMCDRDDRVFSPEKGRFVLARYYVPSSPFEREEDQCDGELTSKVCSGCEIDLALVHFSPSRGGRGGVKAKCKACCAEYAREYASTTQGKAARARAQAKFHAHLAAEERRLKDKAAFIEAASKTPVGRALLDAAGMTQEVNQKGEKC